MSDGKVAMPSSGEDSSKTRSDGVSDTGTHGRGVGGESGGASYDNPHTGKGARGDSGGFEGGQSSKGYFGKGQLDGAKADRAEPGVVGQGGGTDVARDPSDANAANEPHRVTAEGQSCEVIQASGVAEAELNGKVGTDAPYEAEQKSPGSG